MIDILTSGDCDDDSEGGEGEGDVEEAHDALKARLLYEGQVMKMMKMMKMKVKVKVMSKRHMMPSKLVSFMKVRL